ncbi:MULTISPECIES: hypothetical protein [unclassified Nocardiopsis]|uniref:hypothetical protein n=1 Tax=unclassified Nocardiopsis TaxID=2649073 RepID=UPI00135BED51|nr:MULTISPECIES: hypothetical protein [unclassified Nocardiopsis]
MSLMFMLFALSGALLVLGGGSYALRWILLRTQDRAVVPERPAEPDPGRGGYVPAFEELPGDR